MKDNVIQLPGASEREWKIFDNALRENFEKNNASGGLIEEVSMRMKDIFFEANKKVKLSVSFDGDVENTIASVVEQTVGCYGETMRNLLMKIAALEVELYKSKSEREQSDV